MKLIALQRRTHLAALVSILLAAAAWAPAASSNENCEITYGYSYQAEGENADGGSYSRTTHACVTNLTECRDRAATLAREDSRRREFPPYEHGRVDMGSIRVTNTDTEGACDRID